MWVCRIQRIIHKSIYWKKNTFVATVSNERSIKYKTNYWAPWKISLHCCIQSGFTFWFLVFGTKLTNLLNDLQFSGLISHQENSIECCCCFYTKSLFWFSGSCIFLNNGGNSAKWNMRTSLLPLLASFWYVAHSLLFCILHFLKNRFRVRFIGRQF